MYESFLFYRHWVTKVSRIFGSHCFALTLHKFSSFSLEYEQEKAERVQRDFLYMKYSNDSEVDFCIWETELMQDNKQKRLTVSKISKHWHKKIRVFTLIIKAINWRIATEVTQFKWQQNYIKSNLHKISIHTSIKSYFYCFLLIQMVCSASALRSKK